MCCQEPNSPICEDFGSKVNHKRNLSNGTSELSPPRRSKRQKPTTNFKELSSPEASDSETEEFAPAVKKEADDKPLVDTPKKNRKKAPVKKESNEDVKPIKARKSKKDQELESMPLVPRTKGLRMFVGAHVSAAKGVFNSIQNSENIGHVLPHGSYLVNLAQDDKAKSKQAYNSFLDDLRRCEALGITLYNFHPGSTNQTPLPEALSRLANLLVQAISETKTVVPVLETMCGHGNSIGGALSEFRDLLALIPREHHSRIGICVDTCHSFAAGYDLKSPAGFKAFLDEFDELIGIQFLRALHLNDSKAPRGSKRDLHANIGTGFLGLRAFHNVMNEPRFEGLPMVLETPIDRVPGQNVATGDDAADSNESGPGMKKQPKKGPKRPAGAGAAAVPDPGVWAGEIKLLESLIGMDPEGEEFRALEARLSEEGRAEREKLQDQYERKLEADGEKKAKGSGKAKGQKSLMDMMKGGTAKG
ncbi:DNA (Apurinic or apyrimidinic site) lyase, endon uclease [Penicillium digitatum PHI26]|uniref:Apurinic-apyrimidinic endonuclease 1 n=2 Tax=Penicillium digitatum TaxID=36651 RepID=K9FC69_PEND2|nr:DNA (Apurinic or apyrimidinic site) lyase, endon uclease [Penicillium digitatum Pd1]EKV04127.1 DNA (Apurinic or apyrimidinic site) lyase, endon uclease [Penicillium digitatum Pd1]EKV05707.1 DNA (Apurinic or apyrimidinic site) lyase, endon uclease [Penicillium digitatum PHI26]